jgi:translation initiation factor 1A
MYVRCIDGHTRLCRVPGSLRRSMWVKNGDAVIVSPWEYDPEKGDIIYTYRKGQVEWLRKKGFLKDLEEF